MITKITGEQPFQILSSSFSISPSLQTYVLQISADGVNYSDLFTVPAGETRMVTRISNGSFFRCKNNASELSVNWMRECSGGGGTGGDAEYAESAGTSNSTRLLEGIAGFPENPAAGDVVAVVESGAKRGGAKGPAATVGIYQYDGSDWVSGAQGPQGPQGDAGADGAQGPQGPEGPQGPQGENGINQDPTKLLPVSELPSSAETGEVVALASDSIETADLDVNGFITAVNNEELYSYYLYFSNQNYIYVWYDYKGATLIVYAYNGSSTYIINGTVQIPEIEQGYYPIPDMGVDLYCYLNDGHLYFKYPEDAFDHINVITEGQYDITQILTRTDEAGQVGLYQATASGWTAIGGGAGGDYVHCDVLPATGETGITYEYQGRLMTWNPNGGKTAEWLISMGSCTVSGGTGLIYSTIPEGQTLFEFHYNNKAIRKIIYSGGSVCVFENDNTYISKISLGQTNSFVAQGGGSYEITCNYDKIGHIGFYINNGTASLWHFDYVWDGTVSGGHYELIDKYNYPYFWPSSTPAANATSSRLPVWNENGQIYNNGMYIKKKPIYINSTASTAAVTTYAYFGDVDHSPSRYFVPTTPGTQGQVLTSTGGNEPTWTNMPSGGSGSGINFSEKFASVGEFIEGSGEATPIGLVAVTDPFMGNYASLELATYGLPEAYLKSYSVDNSDPSDPQISEDISMRIATNEDLEGLPQYDQDLREIGAGSFIADNGPDFDPEDPIYGNTDIGIARQTSDIGWNVLGMGADGEAYIQSLSIEDSGIGDSRELVAGDVVPLVGTADAGYGYINRIVSLTQADYDDLVTYDNVNENTLYLIIPAPETPAE